MQAAEGRRSQKRVRVTEPRWGPPVGKDHCCRIESTVWHVRSELRSPTKEAEK